MDVRILGPLEVRSEGRPLPLGGTRQRAVLAMLALRANRVVAVDTLVAGLWGEALPSTAVNTLQVYVSRLRRTLHEAGPGAVLERRRPGYLLTIDPEALDLHRFERLTREGTQALPAAPARAATLLGEALSLWRGTPLAEFADEPFARTESPRLEELWINAVTARVEADLALGRHGILVSELQALVGAHPLQEELHRQLIVSLYRCGRQGEALQAYQRLRHILAEQLGIDPNPALRQLETAVLAQDPLLDWVPTRSAGPAAEAGRPAVWSLPPRNVHFTGRRRMLDELHERLTTGEHTQVQAMHGLGGVGKSQLAIEYAYRFRTDYDVAWWIEAERPALIAHQLAALAAALHLPTDRAVTDTVAAVLAVLRHRARWLLIFDNAGHPAQLLDYLPGGPGHVLITSRHPGWGALGGRLEVDVPARAETVALLCRRLPDTPDDLADRLAAELGDLPLAVAQAVGYLEVTGLPAATYLDRFRTHRARLLARGEVIGYRGRVDTTWTLSLDRLRTDAPATVQLLQLAAFLAAEPIPLRLFTGHPELLPEPLRTAAGDPDEFADLVAAAVGLSLVRRQGDHIRLHRLVQAVIRHQLSAGDEQLHRERVLALLAAQAAPPCDPAGQNNHAELAAHVLAVGSREQDHPTGRRLLLDTLGLLHATGDSRACQAVAAPLLDRCRQVLGPDHADTLTAAALLASALVQLGATAQARTLGEDTVERCRRVLGPDHVMTLLAAASLTDAFVQLGAVAQARTLGEDTVERCRRILGGDHIMTLLAASSLTDALVRVGEPAAASRLGDDTTDRCRRVLGPDHPVTLYSTTSLSLALMASGAVAQARTLAEDTVERCRRVLGPDHLIALYAAVILTDALVESGTATAWARALAEDTVERCGRIFGPDSAMTSLASASLVGALGAAGEATAARRLGDDIVDRCHRIFGPGHHLTEIAVAARAAVANPL